MSNKIEPPLCILPLLCEIQRDSSSCSAGTSRIAEHCLLYLIFHCAYIDLRIVSKSWFKQAKKNRRKKFKKNRKQGRSK